MTSSSVDSENISSLSEIANLNTHHQKLINRFVGELTTAAKLEESLPPKKRVTIYGSARILETDPIWSEIEQISQQLRASQWMVISGGGPGVMQAALAKVESGLDETIAFRIDINREKGQSKADLSVNFKDFFIRKYFLREADAFIAAPGGFGTLDELFELITLVQTNKKRKCPIILYKSEYWSGLLDWIRQSVLARGLISPEDMDIFVLLDNVDQVVEYLIK